MKGISVRREFGLMTKNVNLLLLTARKLGTCTGFFRQTQYTMRSMRLLGSGSFQCITSSFLSKHHIQTFLCLMDNA